MIIKCRPFYLPREYTAILLVAVYIPPSSNNNNRSEALNDLYQHTSEQQTAHPDAFLILAGDFNHADLKSVFPKIHQHIDIPTREKILWTFYTTQRGAWSMMTPWGLSDSSSYPSEWQTVYIYVWKISKYHQD